MFKHKINHVSERRLTEKPQHSRITGAQKYLENVKKYLKASAEDGDEAVQDQDALILLLP